MKTILRRLAIWGLLLLLLAAGLIYALRPQPQAVDLATAEVAPLLVTVGDEGEARVRDVYILYAPLGGNLRRIEAEAGDRAVAGETELARIEPATPSFLDVRSEAEQQAAIEAAEAAQQLAEAEVERVAADLSFAAAELSRAQRLIGRGTISERALDEAERAHRVAAANLETAKAALAVRESELRQARSRLLTRQEIAERSGTCECVPVTAPVSGTVLRVIRESAGVVAAGAPLLEIGDPAELEIVVDLLSEDAVRIAPGQKAIVSGWGGPELTAEVRRIEPFGRTEISALGIEEQRVDVLLDLVSPQEDWGRLGHGYRVDVGVVLFEGEVLQVPLGALFRDGESWAVFRAAEGEARLTPVEIGARNDLAAEIRSGLEPGQQVVLYPSDRIADGSSIEVR